MRVLVLTTSYPRSEADVAGVFVRDAVEQLRRGGVEVVVVSPASFRHFGIAFGDGIANNLRAAPWRLALLPLFLFSFARAARRAAGGVDVVHAHWIPSGLAGLATGRPLIVQLWGSDAELAKRLPWLFRPILRRARMAICASSALARDATALGAREVRVIPSGVAVPAEVGEPDEPPHVLYVGRLSEEKGVRDLVQAAEGLPLVVVGDGPLRDIVSEPVGFVPSAALGSYYERAAVVVVPSRREGFGVVAREALAHGRAVVATDVGGLPDVIEDGVTGLLVAPRDPVALREALDRLLSDESLRRRLGERGREAVTSWDVSVAATIQAYEDVLGQAT